MAGSLRQVAGESMVLSDRCAVRTRLFRKHVKTTRQQIPFMMTPPGILKKKMKERRETYVLSFASHTVEK